MKTFKPKFKEGDVVRQKNGNGPKMTVVVCGNTKVICFWFIKNKKMDGVFLIRELMKAGGSGNVVPV